MYDKKKVNIWPKNSCTFTKTVIFFYVYFFFVYLVKKWPSFKRLSKFCDLIYMIYHVPMYLNEWMLQPFQSLLFMLYFRLSFSATLSLNIVFFSITITFLVWSSNCWDCYYALLRLHTTTILATVSYVSIKHMYFLHIDILLLTQLFSHSLLFLYSILLVHNTIRYIHRYVYMTLWNRNQG